MPTNGRRGPGIAFLLSQLGAVATAGFAEAVGALDLTPAQAGVLRQLGALAPLSQQDLARALGTAPSRVVAHLDDLERRELVERRPGADRRINLVSLTARGRALLLRLGQVARAHEAAMTSTLTAAQRTALLELLTELGAGLQLQPGVHPGHAGPATRPAGS